MDWEKFKVFFNEHLEFKNERYHLNWAGKSHAFRLLQQPSYKTLKPVREESVNFDDTENLFIEGDNLEVLKLLQKSYFGKIKMIYIDPPYNTGNDFIYKDDFSEKLTEYKQRVGDIDQDGKEIRAKLFKNTKENGHYHSHWLNMMYPRLFLSRNLLREDGVIFVSIDDNEVYNLRLIMNEIFGEENFVAEFVWNTKKAAQGMITKYRIVCNHEYVLAYCKSYEHFKFIGFDRTTKGFSNPDNDERGPWKRQYLQRFGQGFPIRKIVDPKTNKEYIFESPYTEKKLQQWIQENRILFPKDGTGYPARKEFLYEYKNKRQLVTSLGVFTTKSSTEKLYKLFENKKIFPNPKPIELLQFFLKVTTEPFDIILDFFAGSGTTAQAVMELNQEDGGNRKFILVQLPEPTDPNSEAYKAGYKTIADIAKERIYRAAKKIQQELNEEKKIDLGFKVFILDESNFKQWHSFIPKNPEQIKKAVLEFSDNIKPQATTENILYELMLKNGKKLTEKIQKFNTKSEQTSHKGEKGFWVVGDKELVIILEKVDKSILDEVLKLKPQKVVFLDNLFKENDSIKANFIFSLRDAGIEFKSY
ncbi:MAG: site-specific DNA-methyltransferase [Leptonema sp. (in: bacteria)]